MNNNNEQYENYYGIPIFNDLHNYFPEILYGTRFQNDGLVQYIRQQVSNRFNLYSSAQNNYRTNQTNLFQQNQQLLQSQQINRINTNPILIQSYQEPAINSIVGLLQTMLSSNLSPSSQDEDHIIDDLQPVVVRPTQNQIENGSSIVELTSSHNICAICQENMQPSQTIRRLNQCRHMFHHTCIMNSFNTSPRCPNCRNDIRG